MATKHVYMMKFWSHAEERPWIDFELQQNQLAISFPELGAVLNGKISSIKYTPIHLVVHVENAEQWDSYEVAGTYGLLSKRVIDQIGTYFEPWFELLEAKINNSV